MQESVEDMRYVFVGRALVVLASHCRTVGCVSTICVQDMLQHTLKGFERGQTTMEEFLFAIDKHAKRDFSMYIFHAANIRTHERQDGYFRRIFFDI